jgi:hypothetical protein
VSHTPNAGRRVRGELSVSFRARFSISDDVAGAVGRADGANRRRTSAREPSFGRAKTPNAACGARQYARALQFTPRDHSWASSMIALRRAAARGSAVTGSRGLVSLVSGVGHGTAPTAMAGAVAVAAASLARHRVQQRSRFSSSPAAAAVVGRCRLIPG